MKDNQFALDNFGMKKKKQTKNPTRLIYLCDKTAGVLFAKEDIPWATLSATKSKIHFNPLTPRE